MVHRPYYSDVVVNDYTKGVDVTVQDVSATDEYLVVNKSKEVTVYIDAIDVKQNKYDAANKYIDRMTYALKKGYWWKLSLKEVLNAEFTISDGDFGGTEVILLQYLYQMLSKFSLKLKLKWMLMILKILKLGSS